MIIFGTDMRLSMHTDDKKTEIIIPKIIIRNTLILGKGQIDGYMTLRWLQRKNILSNLQCNKRNFVWVCIIMGWIVIYLLIMLKSLNSKQNILKYNTIVFG